MADSSPLAHSPTLAVTEPRVHGDSERLVAGTAVGEYVIERFIGAGAMGEVYAGNHPVIGKRVAIKVLRPELAASAEAAERFIREARAVNQIDHDHVVDVFAFGRLDDGRLYLVMDLIDGRSLRAQLVDGPLELGNALEILETIADALDAAHQRGVVHRDLKPDNIVLSNATPPKVFVLDFGIAKLIAKVNAGDAVPAKGTGPGTLTGAGTWLGTPGYMAPEQWSADGAGPASDRYALGVIAFELLAGAQPFTATSVPAMMEQHFRAEVPTLSSRGAIGLPSALDSVMRKALAKDPEDRYRTARELVIALRDAAGTGAMRARGAITPPSGPRKRWVPALAGVAVLGVGIVVIAVLGRDHGEPDAPRARARNTPPAGSVAIDVTSLPAGAEVRSNQGGLDMAPTQLFAAPGDTLELTIRKPGYLPERRTVQAGPSGSVVAVKLIEVDDFAGIWQLPNGELRVFERRGDQVDVSKITSLTGDRTFFTRYTFELVDSGIGFVGEDLIADPYAPTEPTCNVRMRVDYVYDPEKRTLEQRREHVDLGYEAGKCIERSRRVEPALLTRPHATQTHELAMPVGKVRLAKPIAQQKVMPKSVKRRPDDVPLDPQAALDKNRKAARPTSQIVPQQANAPINQVTAEPQAQQAAPPPQKAPGKQAADDSFGTQKK